MPRQPSVLRLLKWFAGAGLGLHLLLALLLLGRYPALFRGAALVLSNTSATPGGMRLAVYRHREPSGKGWRYFTPGALARLDIPNTSLDAYAIWRLRAAGTYTLVFRCDDDGAVFIDGHRVIGLHGLSINNIGRAAVPLDPGPHVLVVHLANGPEQGWFTLEAQGPGQSTPTPIPPQDLRPLNQRHLPYFWRAVERGGAWIRGPIFWISLVTLSVLAAASWQARTLKQAALNGLLMVTGSLTGAIIGEIGSRFFLPTPARVTFKTTSNKPAADQPRDVFMIPTERGFRHSPNSEVVVVHPAARDTPTVYKTNSLGYRNREIGPKQGERILFLGDSITLGLALNEQYTFVRRVEDLARADGARWETINAGVNGLGTNGELAMLNETGLTLSPDVVVLGFYLNDFLESPGIYLTRLPGLLDRSLLAHQLVNLASRYLFLSPSEREALDSPPMLKPPDEIPAWQDEFRTNSTVLPRNQPADKAVTTFNEEVLRNFEDWGGAFSPHVWGRLEGLLTDFARLAREHRFRFVIVAFPVRHQVESAPLFDYPQRRLREISHTLEVPLLDLLPLFRAEYEKNKTAGRPMFFDQCHLTPYGSEIVAPAVYEFLKQTRDKGRQPGGAEVSRPTGPAPETTR
jgi:lysophospholipase L1-like esterase